MKSRDIYCLGIASSPRIKGNTTFLLEHALKGCSSTGAKTEILYLNRYKYSPCRACDGCFKHGECIIDDDMQIIYKKLLSADRIILAAPIFSMGMCAQAKAMIDRTQRFWSTKYIIKRDVINNKHTRLQRKGMFISVAGSNKKNVFDGALRVANYFFLMIEAELYGSFTYAQVDEKGAILNHPSALEEVYNAAINLSVP